MTKYRKNKKTIVSKPPCVGCEQTKKRNYFGAVYNHMRPGLIVDKNGKPADMDTQINLLISNWGDLPFNELPDPVTLANFINNGGFNIPL